MPNFEKNTPPSCERFEELILESIESAINAQAHGELNGHLDNCPACRAFLAEQERLDVLLQSSFQARTLPANFKTQLLSQVREQAAAHPAVLENSRSEAVEFRPKFTIRNAISAAVASLDWVGFAVLALLAMLCLASLLPEVPMALPSAGNWERWLPPVLAGGSLVFGLAYGLKDRWREMTEWIW